MKRNPVRVLIVVALVAAAFAFLPVRATGLSSATTARYSVSGKIGYMAGDKSVGTTATVTYTPAGGDAYVSVAYDHDYFGTPLPFNASTDLMYVSVSEASSGKIGNVTVTSGTVTDPFLASYGLQYYEAVVDIGGVTSDCKWEHYTGILIHAQFSKDGQLYDQVTFTYASSSIDLYANYSQATREGVALVKALASPGGVIVMVVIAFVVIIGIGANYEYNKQNTKEERYNRNGK